MTAGRPRQVDARTLSGLAHHFYWELRNLDEGLFKTAVDQERREQLLRKSKEISLLTDASLVGLMRAADRQIQSGLLPADRREDWIRENREEIEHGRHFTASNTAMLLSQKSVRIREDPVGHCRVIESNHAR